MKKRGIWLGIVACLVLLVGLVVQRWPMARAQPQPQVAVAFTSQSYTVTEGNLGTISVTLSQASTQTVTVTWHATGTWPDGSALDETGTVDIPAGQTSASYSLTIPDDACCQGTQTVNVSITYATYAAIGTPADTTVTIVDNDTCP